MNLNTREEIVDDFKGPTVTIIAVEAHWSRRTKSNGFCLSTWKRLLRRVKADPRARVVIVDDLQDADRPTTRETKAIMGLGRPEVLNEDDLNHMDEIDNHLLPDLKPIADKIIGAVDGDHYRVFGHRTSTQYIMEKLGIPNAYLGERMGWVRLKFKRGGGDSMDFDIFLRHGKGSSTTFGTDVNALVKRASGFDADLHIAGHTHRQWFVKVPYLYCDRVGGIRQRVVGYARAGSLLRGFLFGEATYAESAEYSPLSIGFPEIQVHIRRACTKANPSRNLYLADIRGLT